MFVCIFVCVCVSGVPRHHMPLVLSAGSSPGPSLQSVIDSYQMWFFTVFALLAATAIIIIGGYPALETELWAVLTGGSLAPQPFWD